VQIECARALDSHVLKTRVAQIRAALTLNTAACDLADQWLLPVCAVSPYIARICLQFPEDISGLFNSGVLTLRQSLLSARLSTSQTYSLAGIHYSAMSTDRKVINRGNDNHPVGEPASTQNSKSLVCHLTELISELEGDLVDVHKNADVQITDVRSLEAIQQKILRRFRHRHMVRILWRDLTGIAAIADTLRDLSALADACVIVAERWSYNVLSGRYGLPCDAAGREQRLIVLGMGKLGGYELNVSSDIDLICVWPESGQTQVSNADQKVMDNSEFFRRLVQRLTVLLNSVTAEGFVFRVDTRLRPFGESGPLVMNFEGLENYYLTQARDWERYAMIKARAITGNQKDIHELDQLVMPFVYRRYMDYAAFESLRDLKRKIALSVTRKGMIDNIKLGSGGIREIEFIGQAFQLVRGGRDSRFQIRPIVDVLALLAELQLMPQAEVDGLTAAYVYLRRVENALQMMRDEQTHSLPIDADDQQRLLMMMDEPAWDKFKALLAVHQQRVAQSFGALFESEDTDAQTSSADHDADVAVIGSEGDARRIDGWTFWAMLSEPDLDPDQQRQLLTDEGFDPTEELLAAIKSVSHGAFYQRLTAKSQERLERIVPIVIQLSLNHENPSQTLTRALALVRAVAGRSGYLQVLIDQPTVLSRLVTLFAESRWLSNFVLRQPMVIDELLAGPGENSLLDAGAVREDSLAQAMRLLDADLDVQMDTLRHYRQGREMRIACAQLDGTLTLMQVSDQLTWLAESLIEAVLLLVETALIGRHGHPQCNDTGTVRQTSVGVVAYGKLGGLELGFGSDLDLVFVHDSAGSQQQTDGEKSVATAVFYARLAQKFVHFMGTTTPAGVLYEIDMRLRPNGSSGVLVTGIEAFANYQQADAWTWEHQALMRARMVVGNPTLRLRFNQIRAAVLGQRRSEAELRDAVAKMRERMRTALGSHQEGHMHLKQDAGGVADIEFVVQYLVLAHASEYPDLLDYTDNIRVLDIVENLQLLPQADAELLRFAYLALRERLHRQALQELSPLVALDEELIKLRDAIVALRTQILGPSPQ